MNIDSQMCGRCRLKVPLDDYALSYRGRSGTWCRRCFAAFHRGEDTSVPLPFQNCSYCKEPYRPGFADPRTGNKYCSRICKFRAKNATEKANLIASKPDRSCLHCGTQMLKSMRIDAAFCSEKCNSAAHAVTRQNASRCMTPRPDRLTFRALIAERTNWMCGICGEPVDRAKRHPDPAYGSIDHIVPLSNGGSNDESNLQIAHLLCNLRKGNSLVLSVQISQ